MNGGHEIYGAEFLDKCSGAEEWVLFCEKIEMKITINKTFCEKIEKKIIDKGYQLTKNFPLNLPINLCKKIRSLVVCCLQ